MKNVYVDTNVLRDCLERRNDDSIVLMNYASEKKIICKTSIFSFIELVETKKDDKFFYNKIAKKWEISKILRQRHEKDLTDSDFEEINNELDRFKKEREYILTESLTGEGWNLALKISNFSNLSVGDSIHLAIAGGTYCDLLVTSDNFFIKSAKQFIKKQDIWPGLKILNPNDALEIIKVEK
ncbi:MAG TPA: hypothetical protein VJG83_05450 [archaeon]|nr:hypothetical protein [archaeon]